MTSKLSLFDLLRIYGVDPDQTRLVRHGNRDMDILETYLKQRNKLTEYTAWQKPGKFGNAKYIAIFSPSRGTTSLFLGIWEINGFIENRKLQPKHRGVLLQLDLPERMYEKFDRYDLIQSPLMDELSQRLVIEWGKSAVSWVQKGNKPIVEIKPPNSIGEFTSYDKLLLSYRDLQKLIQDKDSNSSWVNALSSVNGVYLIKHVLDSRLYVGSAYGKGGILGRWESYAKRGHAGNKRLSDLNPHNFVFSVLEISPSTMSAEDVIGRENRWKECLGTRDFGLNDN